MRLLHKKHIQVIACLLGLGSGCAHAKNENTYHIQRRTDGNNVMPFISSNNVQADKRINDYLFIDALNQLSTQSQQKDTTAMPKNTAESYSVVRNDNKVLVLNIRMEYCGAYCEGDNVSYHFDAQTGYHIGLSDVFTEQGIAQLDTKINRLNIAHIERMIKSLKRVKRKDDTVEAQLEMYTYCLNSKKERTARSFDSFYNTFQIGDRTVTFTSDRCSNHAMRAIDDIGDFDNSLPSAQLTPYLTTYGKALLNHTVSSTYRPSAFDQVLYGTLGNSRITMLLNPPQNNSSTQDRSISGQYFYNQYKTSIDLFGSIKDNKITLNENDKQPVKTITLTTNGTCLNGFWFSEGQSHPISVKP